MRSRYCAPLCVGVCLVYNLTENNVRVPSYRQRYMVPAHYHCTRITMGEQKRSPPSAVAIDAWLLFQFHAYICCMPHPRETAKQSLVPCVHFASFLLVIYFSWHRAKDQGSNLTSAIRNTKRTRKKRQSLAAGILRRFTAHAAGR